MQRESKAGAITTGQKLGMDLLQAFGMEDARHVTGIRIECSGGGIAELVITYAIPSQDAARLVQLARTWTLLPMRASDERTEALGDLGPEGVFERVRSE